MRESKRHIHYVVVVHGIGTQRFGETALQGARGFMRALNLRLTNDQPLTLPAVVDALGYPKEGDGMPGRDRPWLSLFSCDGREEWRFTEVWWADLLREGYEECSMAPRVWAETVLERMRGDARLRELKWPLDIIGAVADTALASETILGWRKPFLRDLIFDRFISDVQVYAEYQDLRDKAWERFDRVLHRLVAHPEFATAGSGVTLSVLSHSLGSVLSFDALRRAAGSPATDDRSGHWLDAVDNWFTLGSPIDKLITIWAPNFQELESFDETNRNIRHANYCDEQDPVGHNLKCLRKRADYGRLCEPVESLVFSRYRFPGKAHVDYWTDEGLFARMANMIVSREDSSGPSGVQVRATEDTGGEESDFKFRESAYRIGLQLCYYGVPVLVLLANAGLLLTLAGQPAWQVSVACGVALFFVWRFGKNGIRLGVFWRQVSRQKLLEAEGRKNAPLTRRARVREAISAEKTEEAQEQEESPRRQKLEPRFLIQVRAIRWLALGILFISGILASSWAAMGAVQAESSVGGPGSEMIWVTLGAAIAGLLAAFLIDRFLFWSPDRGNADGENRAEDPGDCDIEEMLEKEDRYARWDGKALLGAFMVLLAGLLGGWMIATYISCGEWFTFHPYAGLRAGAVFPFWITLWFFLSATVIEYHFKVFTNVRKRYAF